MMNMSRITSKYQVTIPNEIRHLLKAEAGDRLMFRVGEDGEVYIRTVKKVSVDELAGSLRRDDIKYFHIDEVRRSTQEETSQRSVDKERDEE
ncbi:AbrB/MazE/SpoVT family DNA-binding domain-containing protein [Alicyclobacillus fastidiosus]|uniref:AbrB/MazE/SpoVT family DNA-binding domain-containing protein n=1 Tax=Alicyclobacillus fastidiosus TaxID=392011 RepID=UPI0023E9E60A|nr:AbrB/MazE/SpoVT family DNA-binding domain-containing protein [Alicyclobacillus fastidiosus]GMA66069.1 hypothetical protein GCM10025859_65110 [Alicyclobacillus fastidiosus]